MRNHHNKGTCPGWIARKGSLEKCKLHYCGQLHPETRNLLLDEPDKLAEEERRSILHFKVDQQKKVVAEKRFELQAEEDLLSKMELELIKRTPTVRLMPAVKPNPEIEILKVEDYDPHDLGWKHGYDDELPNCPWPEGTPEYKSYQEGYEEGTWNS